MKIHLIDQGTDSWRELRRGKFTASVIPALFMGKSTKGYEEAIMGVVEERMTGKSPQGFHGEWMKRGNELEPMARQSYEVETLTLVDECGFIEVDEWLGCSPDGLIGEDGMVQIKCVKFNTQVKYLLNLNEPADLLRLEKDYYIQMQAELWTGERKWNDFYSFHPDLPSVKIRIYPDKPIIERMATEIELAKQKVEETIKKIEACRR